MTLYQALLRPVEITSSNNTATYTRSGGGGTVTLTAGPYANILAVADTIRDLADFSSVYINSSGKIVLTAGTSITLTHSELWRSLGFSGNESSGTTVTADYTPLYTWFPTYQHADTEWWHEPSEGRFFGSEGSDGNMSGIAVEKRKRRRVRWTAEIVKNVFGSANQTSYTDSVAGLTRVDKERCFWETISEARDVSITSSSTGSTSVKGVYYIEDFNQFTGSSPSTAWPEKDAWGSGDAYWEDTTNTSTYIFCSVSETPPSPSLFKETHNSYYDPACTLTHAVAPTWTAAGSFA